MDLKFHIKHQVLKRVDNKTIVNLSQDLLYCDFEFISYEWEGIPKYVIFTSSTGTNNLIYLGTEMHCRTYVPNQMLQGDKFKITVYGFVGTYRITAIQRTIITLNSGYTTDITPIDEDADEDFFSRISEEIEELNTIVSTKAELIHQHNISDVSNLGEVLDGKADTNHTHNEYLTEHQSLEDYVKTNDSRLSDSRAPISHTHVKSDITDFSHTHDYDDLTNKPELFTGSYDDLTDKPTLFSGNYEDLSNKPSLFSGNYNDLSNKPSIPSKISDLTDDSDFIEKSSTEGLIKNDGTIDTSSYSTFDGNYNNLTNKPSIPTDVSDLTDTQNTQFTPKSHTHSEYVNPVIVDDLTTDDSSKVLSAKQGKALKGLVDGKASSSHNHTKSDITDFSHDHDDRYYTETEVNGLLDDKLDASDAFSGSYNDLSNKPTIPSKTSDLTNDSNFLTSHQDITGKLDIAQTSYKGKNVVVDSTTGDITFENKPTIPTDVSQLSDNNNTAFTPKSHTHSEYVNPTICDNLTTDSSSQVLSAKQGKALYDMIAGIEEDMNS